MDLLSNITLYLGLVFVSALQTTPSDAVITTQPIIPTEIVSIQATQTPIPIPLPDSTPNPNYKQINFGEKGEDVTSLQNKLKEYGYYIGEVDGAFGHQTLQAIKLFQTNHSLAPDGIAGKQTLTILYESDTIMKLELPTPSPIPSPTPSPTFTPSPIKIVPAITPTPHPKKTITPTQTPTPITVVDNYQFIINSEKLTIPPLFQEDNLYVPFKEILQASGIVVIENSKPTDKINNEDFAFVFDDNLYNLVATQHVENTTYDIQITKNQTPLIMPLREIYKHDNIYYWPAVSITKIFNIQFNNDTNNNTIDIIFPKQTKEPTS